MTPPLGGDGVRLTEDDHPIPDARHARASRSACVSVGASSSNILLGFAELGFAGPCSCRASGTWIPPPPPPGRGGVGGGLKGSAALPSCDTSVSSNASWIVIGGWGQGETIAGGRPRLPGASCMLILGEEHVEAELKLIHFSVNFASALRDRARPASASKRSPNKSSWGRNSEKSVPLYIY